VFPFALLKKFSMKIRAEFSREFSSSGPKARSPEVAKWAMPCGNLGNKVNPMANVANHGTAERSQIARDRT
jgi:hypothetical protein